MQNRKFGVEIEMNGVSCAAMADAIRAIGIECNNPGYTHRQTGQWKCVTDTSIGRGCELVSPILCGDAGIAELRRVISVIPRRARVSRKCGFHVHVDAHDINNDILRKLCKMWVRAEFLFDAIQPPSRRGDVNGYCYSNGRRIIDDVFGHGTDRTLTNGERTEKLFEILDNCGNQSNNMSLRDRYVYTMCGSRYHKLNLYSLARHGTIEFRHHAGTTDIEKIINWTKVCVAFYETARTTREPRTWAKIINNSKTSLIKWFMSDVLNVEPDVAKYYMARVRYFERNAAAETDN